MNVLPFKPVHKTHERMRNKREAEKQRLIQKIGICNEDAPLFSELLRFLAYEESIRGR
jgi:hypothetical protein